MEYAALGVIGIVVELRDLQSSQFELSGQQRLRVRDTLAFELGDPDKSHAGDRPGRGVQRAEIDRLPEGEVVRMEQPTPAIGQHAAAENPKQLRLDVASKIVR